MSPVLDSERFPGNLPPFDLVVSAGDIPGHLLEYLADRLDYPPVYVMGNHAHGYVREDGALRPPGGCLNAHGKVVEVKGVRIAGFEGSPRYRPGPHQYTERQFRHQLWRMQLPLRRNLLRYGRGADILLTHAAPAGPHAGSDWPHRGIPAFNLFHRLYRPLVHVHGHVHLIGANAPREYVTDEGVRVINAFDFTLIELGR